MKWKAQLVEERLSNEDAFAPVGFFSLKRSAFLPCIASCLTYFIIIIQFKLSENPSPIADTLLTNTTNITMSFTNTTNNTFTN